MFNPIYKSIKTRLKSQVTTLKDVVWYNNQYAGVFHAEPIALLEFPSELDINEISKSSSRSNCAIQVHILSKSVGDADSTISDDQVEDHETLCQSVVTALRYHTPLSETGTKLGSSLLYTHHKINQGYKGWLVTILTFNTKISA